MIKSKILLAVLIGLMLSSSVSFAESKQHVGLQVGSKQVNSHDWGDLRDQFEVGIDYDRRFKNSNMYLSIGLLSARNEIDYKLDGSSITKKMMNNELRFGARGYRNLEQNVSLMYGAGLLVSQYELETENSSVDDLGLGFYLECSPRYNFTDNYFLGAKLDYSYSYAKTGSATLDSGGLHYAIYTGFGF